jgi:ABC-type transport system involved in multi-copper enzyme maturation permease subunit
LAGIKNSWKKFIEEENSSAAKTNRHGMKILYEKELSDHLNSIRFRILFLLLAVITFIALYGAISSYFFRGAVHRRKQRQLGDIRVYFSEVVYNFRQ